MNIIQFLFSFFYRIRYWLLWGSLFTVALVVYFTQFLPFSYTVSSSLYAGVTNSTNIDGSQIVNINSTFDNIINIARSKNTLSKVSVRLLATNLVHGDEWKDNMYIQAKHYRQLIQVLPKEVLALVDRSSLDKTVENLTNYRKENSNNFVYSIFNRPYPFYSSSALETIIIRRLGTSDIIELVYTSADPGITQNTLKILEDELLKAYEDLRFSATNNAIAYFEEQVKLSKQQLTNEEDDLTDYSVDKQVINYMEQSKALALTKYGTDDRMEEVQRNYESAIALRKMLEDKMDIRAKIMRTNTNLLQELEKVSTLNQSVLEQEIFSSEKNQKNSDKLSKDKDALKKAEERISHLSDNLNEYGFSKEGVGIQDMITEWLAACVNEAKARAEVQVLLNRQGEIVDQYKDFSPVGTQIKRKERAVGIAEDTYRQQLAGLAEAHLRLQNIKMSTANLQIIAQPEYPLTDNGRKRIIYILLALVGSIVFISGYFLFIELIDRTLRDPDRSKRLTGLPVIAAFNGVSNLKYRGFLKACNRLAAAYSCRQLNNYLHPKRPTVINLLSMEAREGKSFLAKYFIDYWETENIRVRLVRYNVDFDVKDKNYVQAQELSDFWVLNEAEETPDIILVEYPAISTATLPIAVLKKADINLLIANAARLWGNDDDTRLKPLTDELKETPLFLYLNNADREVVESFTGELPPQTMMHSFFSRLSQLGLTSKSAAVK
ncbi:hypothetical protein [uncultured Bacteroides sp.]|uniref:GumC family protein n=1 Tax=uncultured Bacteroides sp. TaxID=162156 RepID=UPI0025F288DB|nr:hypothetical protein [uncultured Bacteroides sp.]